MIRIESPTEFFVKQKQFPHIPFTQSEGWFNYLRAKSREVFFFSDKSAFPEISIWGVEEKVPFLDRKIFRIEGECLMPGLSEKQLMDFYKDIVKEEYVAVEINSSAKYSIDFEIAMRRSGFVRPINIFSCPLSIEIDLNQAFNFDRNWLRNVKKALKSELSFDELKIIDDNSVIGFIRIFTETAMLKKLKYRLEKESLFRLMSSPDIRSFVVRDQRGEILSARIVHEHNSYLSDVYAANSLQARDNGASYFLVDNILRLFKEEGKLFFDFGRIPPSNHSTDSVYLFKNASGGRKIQYNGEWVFYKKGYLENLMFLYKRYILKKQRY